MNLFDFTIIYILKFVAFLSKLLGKGSGTAITGLFIENHYNELITKLAENYKNIVLVSGTNGKTTIQRAITQILNDDSQKVTANISGSNMLRGIAASLIKDFSPVLSKSKSTNFLVLEVEEATMPRLTKLINSNYIILTNLFRDQLDAYGELTKTQKFLIDSCHNNPETIVIFNSADPLIQYIADHIKNPKYQYNLGDLANVDFKYEAKPVEAVNVSEERIHLVNIFQTDETRILVKCREQALQFSSKLPGIYNVLNLIAVLTIADILDLDMIEVVQRLEKLDAPFGRGEILKFKDRQLQILLTKNPAGFEQVVTYLNLKLNNQANNTHVFCFLLNDNRADGKDVSWIWDINLDVLKASGSKIHKFIFSGDRLYDAALRFKYSGFMEEKFMYHETINEFVKTVLNDTDFKDSRITILATYTAMLELRKQLSRFVDMKEMEKI